MKLQTVHVPHLGGIDAAYHMSEAHDPTKPTLVLVNPLMTSAVFFHPQFSDKVLTNAVNLLAIEPLGHGQTQTQNETWTFWDTAIMNLQVMEGLGIENAFALGTSQGGFIVVRMALLAPSKIRGVIPVGTNLDSECQRTRDLGCWNGYELLSQQAKTWAACSDGPEFYVGDDWCDAICSLGYGPYCSDTLRTLWRGEMKKDFAGKEGRHKARMNVINVAERDGLLGRLQFIRCPVLWLQGSDDAAFSVANAEDEIKVFTSTSHTELRIIKDGQHFLSGSHSKEVAVAAVEFVKRFNI